VPPPQALAQERTAAEAASPEGPVTVGVYLYGIQNLDYAKYTFQANFEIWFRWRGDRYDPLANMHIVGARALTVTPEDRRKLADGENYLVARVDAVINAKFDTGAFPFDRHRLAIEVESPFEDDYLTYQVDAEASMLDPDPFTQGWRLSGFRVHELRRQYPTNFGLKERVGDRYSTLIVEVVADRIGWRIAVDHFIGFIVCVLLCLIGYLIPANQLGVRGSLVTTATFAAVGNKYVVNSLTETSLSAPLANVAVITSFAMVLILMITSIRCERLYEAGERTRATRLNRNVGVASAVGYVVVMGYFFWRALMAGPT